MIIDDLLEFINSLLGDLFSFGRPTTVDTATAPSDAVTPSPSPDEGSDNLGYVSLLNYIKQTFPERHSQYAEAYCSAAITNFPLELQKYKNGFTFTRRQFVDAHIAIIEWESKAGLLLHPMGPEGTGDPAPRWFNADKLPNAIKQLDEIPYTGAEEDDLKEAGDHWVQINPPAFARAKVPGWGYGLGQIDFVSHWEWLRDNDWRDPYVNLDKSASIFAHALTRLGNLQNAVQAYNVGEGGNFKGTAASEYWANVTDAAPVDIA